MFNSRQRRFVYSYRSVRRQAVRDGRDWRWRFWPPKWPFREPKEPEPQATQKETALFELALKEAAENDIQLVAERWAELDTKLKGDYCTALAELRQAQGIVPKEQREAQAAAAECKVAEEKFFELPAPSLEPRWAVFWLFIIGIGEFPLNSVVFQIFGQGRLETYLVAGGLCVTIPLFAHWFGRSLRQAAKNNTDKVLIAISPLFVLGLLGVIGVVREKYFQAMEVQNLLGINLTPTQGTIVFILINIGIFFVAAVITYEGTSPDLPTYNSRKTRWRYAQKVLARESNRAGVASAHLRKAYTAYQSRRQIRQKQFERCAQRAKSIKELNDWFISVYRSANREARRTAGSPPCFRNSPQEAKLAEALLKMDWECPGPGTQAA
jgi:hypothetical protein